MKNALIQAILGNQANLKSTRMQEATIRQKEKHLTTLPQISKNDVLGNLKNLLPSNLVPTNIGKYDSVSWPFWFEVEFDYSSEVDFGSGLVPAVSFIASETKEESFVVGQEASFILRGIYRDYNAAGLEGKGAPLKLNIQNKQSTRQFNDEPIQLQHIGDKGHMFKFDVPLLIEGNSKISIELKTLLNADINIAQTDGDGKQKLVFFGERVRSSDIDVVTEIMFK